MPQEPIKTKENISGKLMTPRDVADLYYQLENLGIGIWIDGGWGVDALLGGQTRPHADLDIALQQKDVQMVCEMLEGQGYGEVERSNEWNFVMADGKGRRIDLHAFIFDGNGHVAEGIKYPDGSLAGTGTIDGRAVRCIPADHMVQFHSGYQLRDSDFKDVKALCEKFGIELPEEYKGE
ncbi:MAG: aminoglycoside nucleotidyltransferase [Minisyncoccales bacterium]|jgi:lincosamide nucleotidyltransferase A/C/D/E